MTWVNTANYVPIDHDRFWAPDTVAQLAAGPVTGTAAFQSAGGAYGVSFWQESSLRGMVAETAAYKGDWTYEGFIYIFGLAVNHCLFAAGGWAGAVEANNSTAEVLVKATGKLSTYWEKGVNVPVPPAADSTGVLAINTWYHVGVVVDQTAKTIAYYINGALSSSTTFAFNPTGGDSATPFELRTSFGGYVSHINSNNHKTGCATFSTTKRDATWMAASYTHLTSDGILPTDSNTWCKTTPILLSELEDDVNTASDAYEGAYADGYAAGYTAGYADGEAAHAGDYDDGYADGYAAGYDDGLADGIGSLDSVDPVITVISLPATSKDPLVLDISDDEGLTTYTLSCLEHEGSPRQVIYDPIDGFIHPFVSRSTISGDGSEATPYRFTVYKQGGWPTGTSINVRARAVDTGGNMEIG